MSRSLLTTAVGAVSLMAASPASAEPFQHFLDMCMHSDANAQVAGNAARAAGWTKMPNNALGEGGIAFEDPGIYFFQSSSNEDKAIAGLEYLLTGWMADAEMLGLEGTRLDICAVGAASTAYDAMVEAMETYIGSPPVDFNGAPTWMVSRVGTNLQSESELITGPLEMRREALQDRKLLIAGVLLRDGMIMLILGATRPQP